MANFYDNWLAAGETVQSAIATARLVARDRDIPWISTRQDARVKLMMADELGFASMGGVVMKAEIPAGWHTGKHSHGEEAIHFLKGQGFSIVDGYRFDWHEGTTMQLPYRAVHQHFNVGDEPAQYLSAMCLPLELLVKLGRIEQLEDCGQNDPSVVAAFPEETSQYYASGARATIHLEQAPTDPGDHPAAKLEANRNQHTGTLYLAIPNNGFKAKSVAMTHVFTEPAGYHGGRHKHLEAVLYALEGKGYSEVGGATEEWEAGDVLHVPPAMYEHEHYNNTPWTARQLRIEFGIRLWFQEVWPDGYMPRRIYDERGRPIEAGKIERIRERELS
jgi:quercetin dioxygenase-like cupin family protein